MIYFILSQIKVTLVEYEIYAIFNHTELHQPDVLACYVYYLHSKMCNTKIQCLKLSFNTRARVRTHTHTHTLTHTHTHTYSRTHTLTHTHIKLEFCLTSKHVAAHNPKEKKFSFLHQICHSAFDITCV